MPLGRADPLARLLAIGFEPVAQNVERLAADNHAAAIVTTDYASTAWLSFYLPSHPKIIQLNEEQRYQDAPLKMTFKPGTHDCVVLTGTGGHGAYPHQGRIELRR